MRWTSWLVVWGVMGWLGLTASAGAEPVVATWGGEGLDWAGDMAVAPDGDLVLVGAMHGEVALPEGAAVHALVEPGRGPHQGFVARLTPDGSRVRWVALFPPDRMVSEPDQGPLAMVWDPVRERLVVALWQHGSNVARLPGALVGDTGNISIGWVGVLDPTDGRVEHAWYQHAVRQDTNGNWGPEGQVERWPRNSGNTIQRLAVDGEGRVLVLARGGNRMFTTADAWQDWPRDLWGGHTTLTVLTPDLDRVVYATTFRGGTTESRGSDGAGVVVNRHGVFVFGRTSAEDFVRASLARAPWQSAWGGSDDLFLARLDPDALPFEPLPLEPGAGPGDDGGGEEGGGEEGSGEVPGSGEDGGPPGDVDAGTPAPGEADAGSGGNGSGGAAGGEDPGAGPADVGRAAEVGGEGGQTDALSAEGPGEAGAPDGATGPGAPAPVASEARSGAGSGGCAQTRGQGPAAPWWLAAALWAVRVGRRRPRTR